MDILIAGADTTASTLTAALLQILSDPGIYDKLVHALEALPSRDDSQLPLLGLEKVDYLV